MILENEKTSHVHEWFNSMKMCSSYPQARVNAILVKIPTQFFSEAEKMIAKFLWKPK